MSSHTDVDECSDSSLNFCGTEATCVNNPGSYTCTCNDGYVGDGFICSGKWLFVRNALC